MRLQKAIHGIRNKTPHPATSNILLHKIFNGNYVLVYFLPILLPETEIT